MNPERFRQIINSCTVQDVGGGGIFIRGMDREDLSQLVTLAGQKLGEIHEGARLNPEWLKLGPDQNVPAD